MEIRTNLTFSNEGRISITKRRILKTQLSFFVSLRALWQYGMCRKKKKSNVTMNLVTHSVVGCLWHTKTDKMRQEEKGNGMKEWTKWQPLDFRERKKSSNFLPFLSLDSKSRCITRKDNEEGRGRTVLHVIFKSLVGKDTDKWERHGRVVTLSQRKSHGLTLQEKRMNEENEWMRKRVNGENEWMRKRVGWKEVLEH